MSLIVIALAAYGLQAPTGARAEPAPEDQTICLSDGIFWHGSAQDVSDIHRVPVPASYRRYFFADPCTRWQLIEQTLVDWNLTFGDEPSTTAAISFLEADYTAHMPAPASYQRTLERTWRDAERELAAARPRPGPAAADREGGPALRRLRVLAEAHENLMLLTRQYLRSAELYRSPALLAKAQEWFAIVKPAFDLLYRGVPVRNDVERAGLAEQLQLREWYIEEMGDIEMRLAILRARLSGTPADLDAASAVIGRHFEPRLTEMANQSNEYGGVICGMDNRRGPPELEQACEAENHLGWLAVDVWRGQAQLDLLRATDPPTGNGGGLPEIPAFEQAVRLLEAVRAARPPGPLDARSPQDDLIDLYLSRADLFTRMATARRARQASADILEGTALSDLNRAAALAPPAESPVRFRQAATRFLALHEAIVARRNADPDDGMQWGDSVENARQAAAFRVLLEASDRIVAGESPPPG